MSLHKLLLQYQERKVIVPDGFNWSDWHNDAGIRYVLSRYLTVDGDVIILPIPPRLTAQTPSTIRPLGLMECFAIRKNTPEKVAAAGEFFKTLLSKEGQLALVRATELDQPDKDFRHVPVFRHVVESKEFQEIAARVPAYDVLTKACASAHFTPADNNVYSTTLEAVTTRALETRNYIMSTGDRTGGFIGLTEPFDIEASPLIKNTPAISKY